MFGVCGEQAADADTISFALENGIDYLSCSPYRVLPARLRLLKRYLAGKEGAHKG
jgi:pyruvate,orthophosphate dikinase